MVGCSFTYPLTIENLRRLKYIWVLFFSRDNLIYYRCAVRLCAPMMQSQVLVRKHLMESTAVESATAGIKYILLSGQSHWLTVRIHAALKQCSSSLWQTEWHPCICFIASMGILLHTLFLCLIPLCSHFLQCEDFTHLSLQHICTNLMCLCLVTLLFITVVLCRLSQYFSVSSSCHWWRWGESEWVMALTGSQGQT